MYKLVTGTFYFALGGWNAMATIKLIHDRWDGELGFPLYATGITAALLFGVGLAFFFSYIKDAIEDALLHREDRTLLLMAESILRAKESKDESST